jgi:hypothetical protein
MQILTTMVSLQRLITGVHVLFQTKLCAIYCGQIDTGEGFPIYMDRDVCNQHEGELICMPYELWLTDTLITCLWNEWHSLIQEYMASLWRNVRKTVKLFLCSINHNDMNTNGNRDGTALPVLTSTTSWRWVVSFIPWPPCLRVKGPRYTSYRGAPKPIYRIRKRDKSLASHRNWDSGLAPRLSLYRLGHSVSLSIDLDRLCGLVVRVPDYKTEMYCVCCEVRNGFIYVM